MNVAYGGDRYKRANADPPMPTITLNLKKWNSSPEKSFRGLLMGFSDFPKILYDAKGQGSSVVVTNL